MKNLLLTGFALAACASMAASDVWKVGDIEYNVDTLFHANVGPGTTQTSLHFSSESRNLRVFYLTVDLKNPVLDIRCGTGQTCRRCNNFKHGYQPQQGGRFLFCRYQY